MFDTRHLSPHAAAAASDHDDDDDDAITTTILHFCSTSQFFTAPTKQQTDFLLRFTKRH